MAADRFLSITSILAIALLGISCAIPVMPTGGPVDKQPPTILEANPAPESVNVTTDQVTLVFSEYVDQSSFAQAITVTPAFDRPLEYKWKKKRVNITFPEPLRDNTTYILTIDNKLRDVNRVALTQPITLAFATGPAINKGKITGRIVESAEGKGVADLDVFAYAISDSTQLDSLPPSPAYRTQTNADGLFNFDYMSEQSYFVIGLQDLNRNRTPDGIEQFAAPPRPAIFADSTSRATPEPAATWITTQIDTIPPVVQRVRALSNQRFMVRFSESIQLNSTDPAAWVLKDSVSNQPFNIEQIYLYHEDPRQLYIKSSPLFASTHLLQVANVADSSNNPTPNTFIDFTPSASADTLSLRFLGFFPEDLPFAEGTTARELSPTQQAGVRFNQPVDSLNLTEIVSIQDSTNQPVSFSASSTDGSVFYLDTNVPAGMPYSVSVAGDKTGAPDTTYTQQFQSLTASQLGSLSGVAIVSIEPDSTSADTVAVSSPEGTLMVELYPAGQQTTKEPVAKTAVDDSGTFHFTNLPDNSQYRFRVFLDTNNNTIWDGGQLLPYQKAEHLTWHSDSLQVRARWEQALADTLRLKIP